MNKKIRYTAIVTIVVIALITIIFHYTPHIIDALTREPVPEYGIRISIWRVLFEPILGVMLYLNRSLYPLDEIVYFLLWLLIFMAIYGVYNTLTSKGSKGAMTGRQLANFPIIVGLMFTFFVLLIFIPLPNNTIENHKPNSVLVTTHTHTEYSHDGLMSQRQLWKWHKRNGFNAFFITDHNNHDHTLDFVHAQRDGKFPMEPLVMCGEEFSGTNHLSLLGLKRNFSTRGFSDSTAIDSTRANGGAVIVNHWFDGEHMTLEYYKNLGVDGFEIENTAQERTYDRGVYIRIKDFCTRNQLILIGGLDFHGYGNVCSLWNAFEIPGWHQMDPNAKEASILKIIRDRDQNKVRVLLYKDRPYYPPGHLFIRPFVTVFNYFRTLNVYQVISWAVWIGLFSLIMSRFNNNPALKEKFAPRKVIPVKGIISAWFLLGLGVFYYFKSKELAGTDNDIYIEYSALLFYIGSVFFLYSAIIAYFRIFRK